MARLLLMYFGSTEPIRYRVVVRGRLDPGFAAAFGLERLELESRAAESALIGAFADHAQLQGLLDRLCDLGLVLVSVNPVE